jgi:uncharacterized protein
MEYRKLGRTGLDVGAIGLGTEHLDKSREVRDEVLRTAIAAGVTYVDLLYIDPDYWTAFGPVLRPYRDQLVLAAHWGGGGWGDLDEVQRCFDNVLTCVGNSYVEVGLVAVIDDQETWNGWAQRSIERLHRYQEQGRVGSIGLSTHFASVAMAAVNSGLVDVLMYPISLIGHGDAELEALIRACVQQRVGLVAMKPYHGGTLFEANGRPSGITPAQCLGYVLSLPVSTAVPGPRNPAELRATLRYLEATDEEKDYRSITADLHTLLAGQCVYCHHCLPCPVGIEIGWLLWILDYARHGVTDDLRGWYNSYPVKASACVECGDCLQRCPFDVNIITRLRQAAGLFE